METNRQYRTVAVYIAVSADGYIARPDGGLDWLMTFQSSGENYGYHEFIASVDTVIMGRKTYDTVLAMGYPHPHGQIRHIIVSRSPKQTNGPVEYDHRTPSEIVRQLLREPGKNIYVDGGAETVNDLLRNRLIDEMTISVVPALLGDGIRLFRDGRPEEKMELISCAGFPSGMVQLRYRRK